MNEKKKWIGNSLAISNYWTPNINQIVSANDNELFVLLKINGKLIVIGSMIARNMENNRQFYFKKEYKHE